MGGFGGEVANTTQHLMYGVAGNFTAGNPIMLFQWVLCTQQTLEFRHIVGDTERRCGV